MNFYSHRTVEEQKERLPEAFQANYETTQLDRIEIDGCEIQGYFEYSFMEEKSYMEQPVRSQDGSIENLDDYTTFLTPRLIIKYNMMNIEDYRTLMTFLKSKNTFNVTCYDIVADRRVTHEMYFANPQMPIIYQRYLAVLGVQDHSIELIGTNRRIYTTEIKFYIDVTEDNKPAEYTAYENEDWISFLLRNDTEYKVEYSPLIKRFIVTKDGGKTAVGKDNYFVSPYDNIIKSSSYESQEVQPQ